MNSDYEMDEEDDMQFVKRGEKKFTKLSATAEKKVAEIAQNSQIKI